MPTSQHRTITQEMTYSWRNNESVHFGSLQVLDGLLTFREPVASFTAQSGLNLVLDIGSRCRDLWCQVGSEQGKYRRRVLSNGNRHGLPYSALLLRNRLYGLTLERSIK